jgi:hypothetical protein
MHLITNFLTDVGKFLLMVFIVVYIIISTLQYFIGVSGIYERIYSLVKIIV